MYFPYSFLKPDSFVLFHFIKLIAFFFKFSTLYSETFPQYTNNNIFHFISAFYNYFLHRILTWNIFIVFMFLSNNLYISSTCLKFKNVVEQVCWKVFFSVTSPMGSFLIIDHKFLILLCQTFYQIPDIENCTLLITINFCMTENIIS